ncbi:MAG: GPR endopeptidase, partial [Clostridia bacterium]|nr:GPR endopeptidase [Clostridia bacterium]
VEEYNKAVEIIAKELADMAGNTSLTLVAGLGNREITPDALGCEVVSGLLVTNHMKQYMDKAFAQELKAVCAVAPGVLGTTGIETVQIIKGITDTVKPDLVIAVDALAAADIKRVCTTIQIADTGIQPGAGVGNNRKGLNHETLGVKVIAVGVPTVIDAAAITNEQIPEELAPLMITTKDIDLVIEKMAKAVANGINKALQPKLSLKDIEGLIG